MERAGGAAVMIPVAPRESVRLEYATEIARSLSSSSKAILAARLYAELLDMPEIGKALDPGPVPSSWRGRRAARNPAVEAQIACLCLAGLFLFLAIVWMVTP